MKNATHAKPNGKPNGAPSIARRPRSSRRNPAKRATPPAPAPDQLLLSELAPEEQLAVNNVAHINQRDLRLAHHRAQCTVCRHPCHADIDVEILDWASPQSLIQRYCLGSERCVYRHANFFGLLAKRRTSHLAALDHLIEQVREVPVTASSIVAAVRLSAQLQGRLQTSRDRRTISVSARPANGGRQNDSANFSFPLERLPSLRAGSQPPSNTTAILTP